MDEVDIPRKVDRFDVRGQSAYFAQARPLGQTWSAIMAQTNVNNATSASRRGKVHVLSTTNSSSVDTYLSYPTIHPASSAHRYILATLSFSTLR